jgi:hypothetical protein
MTKKLGNSGAPQAGFENVGRPYLSGAAVPQDAEVQFTLPRASRYFEVTNTSATNNRLRVYLAASGSSNSVTNRHYKTLVPSASFGSYSAVQNIFVTSTDAAGDCEVYAELVDYVSGSAFDLTGSGISE